MKMLGRPRENHGMIPEDCTDTLTGKPYRLWTCPICGRQEKEADGVTVTLAEGNAPTGADAIRFAEMAVTPEGRQELSGILSSYPGHDKFWIDPAGVTALIEQLGIEPPLTMDAPLTLVFG